MDALNWTKIKTPENIEKSKKSGLSETEQNILEEISIEPLSADILTSRLNYDIGELMTILTTMEINGLIKQIDGARYIICN